MHNFTSLQTLRAISFIIFFVNGFEILFLLKTRKRWCHAHILVFNLAIADAVFGLTAIITMSFSLSARHYRFHSLLDIISYAWLYGNMLGSSLIVMLISIDRWIAVKWPFRYRTLMTKTRLYVAALSGWIAGVATVCAMFVLVHVTKSFGSFYFLQVIITMGQLINIYVYCSIFCLYRKSIRLTRTDHTSASNLNRRKSERLNCIEIESGTASLSAISSASVGPKNTINNKHQNTMEIEKILIRMSDKEKRLLKFCLAVVLSFCLSYLPLNLIVSPEISGKMPPFLYFIINVNAFCGSLWNPFLYFLHQFFDRRKTISGK